MQNHQQQMFKQHWSSRFTAAHKSFVFHLMVTRPQHTAPDTVYCPETSVFCKGREQHPSLEKGNSACPRTSCRSFSGWDSAGWHTSHIEHFKILSPSILVMPPPNKKAPFLPRLLLVNGDDTIQENRTNMQSKSDLVNNSRYHSFPRSS